MRALRGWLILLGIVGLCSACAVVPPLREDGVAISDIVQRVKCELAIAMPEPEPPYPTGRYQWMRDWTAKVDLTLITNDQSSITPSASFITPMRPETLPLVGTFTRSFTLGLGAGLTTTAVRNETMSFTLSLKELRNIRYRGECDLPDGLDLYGKLGLKEWIESAVAPVNNDILMIGVHSAPGAKAGRPVIALGRERVREKISIKDQIHLAADSAADHAARAEEASRRAKQDVANYKRDAEAAAPSVLKRDMQDAFDEAESANDDAVKAASEAKKAKDLFASPEAANLRNDPEVLADIKRADDAVSRATAVKKAVTATVKSLPQDSPIDSIGHQVQFIVVATGNVTPAWSLVHFKGPGASGNFAAATDTRTHTLTLALGAPGTSVNASEDQTRTLNNLKLDTLRLQPNQ
jgi:hypothetical protein